MKWARPFSAVRGSDTLFPNVFEEDLFFSDAVEQESSDADSDAEPEAVKFVDSRKNVLDRVRTAIRQIERDRQQLRLKRQKKDTVYKEQKVRCAPQS